MKKLLRILKMVSIAIGTAILLVVIGATVFVHVSPQFGAVPTEEKTAAFVALGNYRDGKFQNQTPTSLEMGFGKTISVMREFIFGNRVGKNPEKPLPVDKIDLASIANPAQPGTRITWFGHSAILLETATKRIFLDPMLGQYAGPVPHLSPARYNSELPAAIEALPFIDAVVISHDHYDHLDYGSMRKLKDKVGRYYVPLGVGSHLESWGISVEKITELNWWEEAQFDDLKFVCAPARHFSGRGFTNNTTLWASWIVQSQNERFYFSGDSGYGPHFKEIGDRYGPFDLVMMECGQFNELWKAIHMMPEETVQATRDVQGKVLLPIHWGAFTLAMHPWAEPVSRVTAAAATLNVRVATPRIGQALRLDGSAIADTRWW